MKKQIEINYTSELEFIATYCKSELAHERESLENHCNMDITQIISNIITNEARFLTDAFQNFAEEVGQNYCSEHQIFHEYDKCPLCALQEIGIKLY